MQMDADELVELVQELMSERRFLVKFAEASYTFFATFAEKLDCVLAQSDMTKVFLDDLMDFAQLNNSSFRIVEDDFDLGRVIK